MLTLYASARNALIAGTVTWISGDAGGVLRCYLLTSAYSPDYANHVHASDLTGIVASAAYGNNLCGLGVSGMSTPLAPLPVMPGNGNITFPSVASGSTITQAVITKTDVNHPDGSSPTIEQLLAHLDFPSTATNGGPITVPAIGALQAFVERWNDTSQWFSPFGTGTWTAVSVLLRALTLVVRCSG